MLVERRKRSEHNEHEGQTPQLRHLNFSWRRMTRILYAIEVWFRNGVARILYCQYPRKTWIKTIGGTCDHGESVPLPVWPGADPALHEQQKQDFGKKLDLLPRSLLTRFVSSLSIKVDNDTKRINFWHPYLRQNERINDCHCLNVIFWQFPVGRFEMWIVDIKSYLKSAQKPAIYLAVDISPSFIW